MIVRRQPYLYERIKIIWSADDGCKFWIREDIPIRVHGDDYQQYASQVLVGGSRNLMGGQATHTGAPRGVSKRRARTSLQIEILKMD